MKSLERSLGIGLLVILMVAFGLLFWAAGTAVTSIGEAYLLTRLEHDAEALLGAVRVSPDGRRRVREGRITPIYQQPASGHYFVVAFADGSRVRSRSLWDSTLASPPLAPGDVVTYKAPGPVDQRLLVRAAGYDKSGSALVITVAEDLTPLADDLQRFQWLAAAVLLATLLPILLSQRYLLRRSFRVLDQVRAEMRQIASGERRQLQTLGPNEIRPLTREVNRLLQQLQQRLVRSRQALGNLAHALKGPLSLVVHDLDALPLADDARQALVGRLDRVTTLIGRELKRAQFAGEGSGQRFMPGRDVPELIAALQRIYQPRKLNVTTDDLPDVSLPFDYEDMLELLGNLLDNAFKWAQSRVSVAVQSDEGLVFRVADDGPGVPLAERAALLQRGSRLDEQEPGSGLGLAIVNDLVAHYRGQIRFDHSDALGGLLVEVHLPVPPRDADPT